MKVYIVLISSSVELVREFLSARESLIPKEIRARFPQGSNFVFDGVVPARLGKGFTIDKHILERCRDCDYIAGFIESDILPICGNIRHAALTAVIDLEEELFSNFQNFFSQRLTRLLKAAIFTLNQMFASEDEQAMRLPIRNFSASELNELCQVYRDQVLEGGFSDVVKRLVGELGERRRPRRRSSFQMKYFVDDESKYFIFGREIHEILPTGPPHQSQCELNGRFRFGRKISTNQHFNVSKGDGDQTYITGQFPNCHDALVTPGAGTTHLNMFSNDHC